MLPNGQSMAYKRNRISRFLALTTVNRDGSAHLKYQSRGVYSSLGVWSSSSFTLLFCGSHYVTTFYFKQLQHLLVHEVLGDLFLVASNISRDV